MCFIGFWVFSAMTFVALIRENVPWDSGLLLGNRRMLKQRQYERSTTVLISSFSLPTSNHSVLGLDLTTGWMLLTAYSSIKLCPRMGSLKGSSSFYTAHISSSFRMSRVILDVTIIPCGRYSWGGGPA